MPHRPSSLLPTLAVAALGVAGLVHGPVVQWPNFHAYADQSVWLGIPHAGDVLSNAGFALVALWGLAARVASGPGASGYRLFLWALLLVAAGSAWYHWAPDDSRLVWDRIGVALACAGLLAGVRAEMRGEIRGADAPAFTWALAAGALASVGWWVLTGGGGEGDLRPYLLLQVAPLLLIPLWLWLGDAARADRVAFGLALAAYALARWAEVRDHEIAAALSGVVPLSGHTLKHLLATLAAAIVVGRRARRKVQDSGRAAAPTRP